MWDEANAVPGQMIEQVWFAGSHSDVGGWYDERGLANVTLHWMLGKASGCGLRIREGELAARRPDPHDALHPSHTGFWKIRGSRTRRIPEGARIHKSVVERMREPGNRYKPGNLPAEYEVVE